MAARKRLEALAREAYIGILLLADLGDGLCLRINELAADVARIVLALRREVGDAVADTKRPLVREELSMDALPVPPPPPP